MPAISIRCVLRRTTARMQNIAKQHREQPGREKSLWEEIGLGATMMHKTQSSASEKRSSETVTATILLFAVVGLLLGVAAAAAPLEPLRAVYLHPAPFDDGRITAEQRLNRIAEVLDYAGACGFTTLLPYGNTSGGRAYYPSHFLRPTGAADGDTLGLLAREAKARGFHVMPAVCVLVSGHNAPEGILEEHLEWALRKPSGEPMGWISPSHADARAWVVGMMREMVGHIRPSGVLLDYLRYPNEEVQLDPASAAAFDAAAPAGETDAARKERLQRFKEESLSTLAREISQALREQQPDIRIALYTWGPHVPFNHPVSQRWPDWVRNRYIDMVNVSGYCYRRNYGEEYLNVFEKRVRDSVELVRQTGVDASLSFALGIHTSHGALESAAEIADYRSLAEKAGCPGVAVFAWAGLEKFLPDVIQGGYLRDAVPMAAETPGWTVRLTVDLGKDVGQNFGSLFEAASPDGNSAAGAGFLGAYNSYYRANRHTLHFYVKPPRGCNTVQVTSFPRPSGSCHHYVFDVGGVVYATDRSGKTPVLRWDEGAGIWTATDPPQPPGFLVGSHRLECYPNRVTVDGRDAFRFDSAHGAAGLYYYAQGRLFFHVAQANSPERRTAIHACPWDIEAQPEPVLEQAVILPLTAPGEFPYSYGQQNNDVLVGSNNGGLYRFRGGQWSTLRTADPKTSFQLYAMINYRNRLFMGQYPSGELFEMVGNEMKRLDGWPPRPEGASASAREAQTLTLYRGDLFAGVWPWGEVWRLQDTESAWEFAGRLFDEPPIEPDVLAPYEKEMTLLGEKVNNLWGQRVPALVPFREGLLASTSNKNGATYENRLEFLDRGRAQEYGEAYRLYLPGHLSVPIVWTGAPIDFEFRITPGSMTVIQDGRKLGSASLPPDSMEGFSIEHVRWGEGVFGPFQGRLSAEFLEESNP